MQTTDTTTRKPHPDDIATGARLRTIRELRGLSQGLLGIRIGVTFQQIQKYEKGTNRIGASRLLALAATLECHVSDLLIEATHTTRALTPFTPATMAIARKFERLSPQQRTAITAVIDASLGVDQSATKRCPHTVESFQQRSARRD